MPLMFSPRSTASRSLAIWLPICLMWMFVACVSLCLLHVEAEDETPSVLTPVTAVNSPDSDCCPFIESTSGILLERQSSIRPVSGDVQASFVHAPSPKSYATRSQAHLAIQPPTSDPPLERLGVRRI